MADVFISYSSKDQKKVDQIASELDNRKINFCIAPRAVTKGRSYAEIIPEKIDECDFFLILMSTNALESDHVRSEIDIAFEKKKIIVPYMLQDIPDGRYSYYLRGKQKILAFKDKKQAIQELVNTVLKITTETTRKANYYIKCPRCSKTALKVGGMRFREYVMLVLALIGVLLLFLYCFRVDPIKNIVQQIFGENMPLYAACIYAVFPFALMAPLVISDEIQQTKNEIELHFKCICCGTKFTAIVPHDYKLEEIVEYPQ